MEKQPAAIEVRGLHVHHLKNIWMYRIRILAERQDGSAALFVVRRRPVLHDYRVKSSSQNV